MAWILASVALCGVASSEGIECPSSSSPLHAHTKVRAVATAANCSVVAAEMRARADAAPWVWMDPHNKGSYTFEYSVGHSRVAFKRSTNADTSLGGKVFTDKILFVLTDKFSSCLIEGCSASQGTSVGDFSTNYCNMRNLYCGSADGCRTVMHDFGTTEGKVSPSLGAGKDPSMCLAVPEEPKKPKCPGSKAFPHASCKVDVRVSDSCERVAYEMQSRVAANQNGTWLDPHNRGRYTLEYANGHRELMFKRTTNPDTAFGGKVYTDKILFTLTQGPGEVCAIQGCSESQGQSVGDFSTNYCNMRNLYCGSADGCVPWAFDLASAEFAVKPSLGASKDSAVCLNASLMV